jgi:hypothetical protein
MHRDWTPSIVPAGDGQTVYLVADDLGKLGSVWREADVETTDLETVITDLLTGQYQNPVRIIASNTAERWAQDVSEDILDEGKEIMDEYKGMPALDAGLLAAAQAVEHYEISRYGTLRTWANELGYKDAVKLLDATLKEEKNTDSVLSQLAESEVNQHAETAEAA